MRHAVIRLEEEMRCLISAWRQVRIDVATDGDIRTAMEREMAQAVLETRDAILLLKERMGMAPILRQADDIAHIVGTL